MYDEVGDSVDQVESQPREPVGFATYILLSALRAPGGARSAQAARTLAGLVNLLTTDGAGAEVSRFLSPEPGGRATFDVLSYTSSAARFGEEKMPPPPPLSRVGLDIAGALKEVARLALAARRIEVVAVGPDGLRRRVLEREERGALRFVYPAERAYDGDPIRRAAAVEEWHEIIESRSGPFVEPESTNGTLTAGSDPAPHPGTPHPSTPHPSTPHPSAVEPEHWVGSRAVPDGTEPGEPTVMSAPAPAPAPSPAELGEAVRQALADLTVEVDLGAIEAMIKETVHGMATEAPLPVPVQRDEFPPDNVEEIAERVAALLAPRLAIPFNSSGAAESSGAWVAQATLMSAAAQLHIQIESFNDRIRAGSRALETLADELASRERSASDLTAQLARSVEASLSRMSHRIDSRLDNLERTDSGPTIAASLQDVIEKLRIINRRLDDANREQPEVPISALHPAGY